MVPFVQANTNGRLHSASEPSLAPLDRGFLYGDTVYEVWRTYYGVIFLWDEHCRRLEGSAAGLYLKLPLAPAPMLLEIQRTVATFRKATAYSGEVYIRFQVSRGSASIGLDLESAGHPNFVVLVQACPVLAEDKARSGLRLSVAAETRRNSALSLNPAWKTGNALNNILCLREARARGADDVVILSLSGQVTEAASSNLGFVQSGTVVTPPVEAGLLNGVTRHLLLDQLCAQAGVPSRVGAVFPEDFPQMDECFLLSSTKGVTSVAAIDGTRFQVGAASITARLRVALDECTLAYAREHPSLKV